MKIKKSVLALIFCFIGLQLSFAQNAFEIGIKGGVNLAQLKAGQFYTTPLKDGQPWTYNGQVLKDNLQSSYDTRQGYVFGVYTRFGKKLFLQPELYVASKGGTIDLNKVDISKLGSGGSTNPSLIETVKVSYTNLDIPVLVGYKLLRIFRVVAGPVASLNIGQNQRLGDALKYYANNEIDDTFNKAVFSYQLGGGVQIGSLGLDVRHESSISEVTSIKIGDQTFGPKAKSWLVTLSYKIF